MDGAISGYPDTESLDSSSGPSAAPLRVAADAVRSQAAGSSIAVIGDEDLTRLACAILSDAGMLVEPLRNPNACTVMESLQACGPALLLLTPAMPGLNGLELCATLRKSEEWKDLPVLFFSVDGDARTRAALYKAGASDYLLHPILAEEVVRRVSVYVDRMQLLSERQRDPLSGVLLRAAFARRVEENLRQSRRERRPVSFCVIELDELQRINETYGHSAGDQVIETFGRILRNQLRADDAICRWAGNRFAVAFSGVRHEIAVRALSKLLSEFQHAYFRGGSGEMFFSSFTAGVSASGPDGASLYNMMHAAEARLHQGKFAGRCRVVGPATAGVGPHRPELPEEPVAHSARPAVADSIRVILDSEVPSRPRLPH